MLSNTVFYLAGLCSKLKNLEVLDLSSNNFNDTDIASAISELSSLKSLDLGYSQLPPTSILSMSHFLYFKYSSFLLVG